MTDNIIDIDGNFDELIKQEKKLVLADFWATWCQPCRAIGELIKQLVKEHENGIAVYKINVDNEQTLLERFDIKAVPTLIIFKNEKEVARKTGMMPYSELLDFVTKQDV